MSRSAMSSADAISARLRDLEQLTKGPAWTLTRSAPWVIAVLQASFTRTRPQLPLEEFHADVAAFLEQLRRQDPALGGQLNGKAFGDEWTRKQFLTRRNQSGQIVYEVTEAAARVLAFLDSLSSERSTLNGSRPANCSWPPPWTTPTPSATHSRWPSPSKTSATFRPTSKPWWQ